MRAIKLIKELKSIRQRAQRMLKESESIEIESLKVGTQDVMGLTITKIDNILDITSLILFINPMTAKKHCEDVEYTIKRYNVTVQNAEATIEVEKSIRVDDTDYVANVMLDSMIDCMVD